MTAIITTISFPTFQTNNAEQTVYNQAVITNNLTFRFHGIMNHNKDIVCVRVDRVIPQQKGLVKDITFFKPRGKQLQQ